MIFDGFTLTQVCTSFEGVLKLEFGAETKTEECLNNAIRSLENAYNITIDKDLYTLQVENSLVSQKIDLLLQGITECMKTTTLYTCLSTYNHNPHFSLSDANYLGFARKWLMTMLKYFQDKDLRANRDQAIRAISESLNTIPISHTKRLFMIMLMLYKLGVHEGVAVVAQLLYLGGIE